MQIPANLLEQVTESVRRFVLAALPYDRADEAVAAHLNGMDATDLLITWFNWSWRMVTAHPRQVHLSREFLANPLRQKYGPTLLELLTDIEKGTDLRKYLSRRIVHVTTPPSPEPAGKRRKPRFDIDPMLNAWGIYHLHMSDELADDGFVSRSDELLFVVFRRGHAFILDIMPHSGAWARESTIRIILDNWPQAQLVHKMEGVVGLSRPIDDDARGVLMQKHVNSGVEIDGAVYVPNGGIMSSGVPMDAVRNADRIMIDIEDFIERVTGDPTYLTDIMQGRSIPLPDELRLEFFIDESGFGLIEPESKTLFKLHDADLSEPAEPVRTKLV